MDVALSRCGHGGGHCYHDSSINIDEVLEIHKYDKDENDII